ncbi:hypothetical protein BDW75DRAFT_89067 [Aspergillus navahoensis]
MGGVIGDAGSQWPSRTEYHQNIEIRPYERSPIEEQTRPARCLAQADSAVAVNTVSETSTRGEVCSSYVVSLVGFRRRQQKQGRSVARHRSNYNLYHGDDKVVRLSLTGSEYEWMTDATQPDGRLLEQHPGRENSGATTADSYLLFREFSIKGDRYMRHGLLWSGCPVLSRRTPPPPPPLYRTRGSRV